MGIQLYSVGLKCVDYARMVAFYRDVLGFPVVRAMEDRDDHKVCFFDAGSPFYLVYDAPRPGDAPVVPKIRARLDVHVDDVAAEWARLAPLDLQAKGPPHPTRFGGFGFSIKDPEGTVIHVLQRKLP